MEDMDVYGRLWDYMGSDRQFRQSCMYGGQRLGTINKGKLNTATGQSRDSKGHTPKS